MSEPRVAPEKSYSVRVIGARPAYLRDMYHWMLRLRWSAVLPGIACMYIAVNVIFAVLYMLCGGVANVRQGVFADAFFFSIQTMGTIGYGEMHPVSATANLLVSAESVAGLMITALITGLVFAKFSQPASRIVFADFAVVSLFEGKPSLMLRVGNERGNRVVEATVKVDLMQTKLTEEGVVFYKMTELTLARQRIAALTRSWNLVHVLDEKSPLFGASPESLDAEEAEVVVSLTGLDETSGQVVHGQRQYEAAQVAWGHRHSDVLSAGENGDLIMDVRKFNAVELTKATASFPYGRA